jgi:hypothetical protein
VKTLLALGYMVLALTVIVADADKPSGYEVSIYTGTPLEIWLGIGFALTVSLIVSFVVRPGWIRTAALGLGGLSVITVAALPLFRDYFYNGTADALTHLGWVRDVSTGATAPGELFYPGIHTVAVVIASVTGIGLEVALLLTVVAITAVGFVCVPLLVRSVSKGDRAVVVAAFSTFLLFLVHNLGLYLHAHTFSQATFFSSIVLFVAILYLTRGSGWVLGTLLAVLSIAVLLYHPQQAANILLVFGVISLVQWYYRRYRARHPIAGHRTLYVHTGLLAVAFVLWITRFEGWAFHNIARVEDAVLSYLAGDPPTAGGSLQSQTASLVEIGSGLPEMFIKMFLVAAIFSALAAALMAAGMLGRADKSRPTANAVAVYLGVGSLFTLPIIIAYFAGNVAEHYFRHIGFLLLVAIIVGSLALSRGIARLESVYDPALLRVAVVLVFAVLVPLSLATVYPSPFMYKQNQHVTDTEMQGYETVFDVNDETLELAGIRDGASRESDAIQGVAASRTYDATVSNANLSRLGAYYADGGYLVETDRDRGREVQAYRELRYSDEAFRSLARQRGVNRVVDNGALRLYHVPAGGG